MKAIEGQTLCITQSRARTSDDCHAFHRPHRGRVMQPRGAEPGRVPPWDSNTPHPHSPPNLNEVPSRFLGPRYRLHLPRPADGTTLRSGILGVDVMLPPGSARRRIGTLGLHDGTASRFVTDRVDRIPGICSIFHDHKPRPLTTLAHLLTTPPGSHHAAQEWPQQSLLGPTTTAKSSKFEPHRGPFTAGRARLDVNKGRDSLSI